MLGARIVEWLPVASLAASLTMCSVKIYQTDGAATGALRFAARTVLVTADAQLGVHVVAATSAAGALRGFVSAVSHPIVTTKGLLHASAHPFEAIFEGALTAHGMATDGHVAAASESAPAAVRWADRWIAPLLLPQLPRSTR